MRLTAGIAPAAVDWPRRSHRSTDAKGSSATARGQMQFDCADGRTDELAMTRIDCLQPLIQRIEGLPDLAYLFDQLLCGAFYALGFAAGAQPARRGRNLLLPFDLRQRIQCAQTKARDVIGRAQLMIDAIYDLLPVIGEELLQDLA